MRAGGWAQHHRSRAARSRSDLRTPACSPSRACATACARTHMASGGSTFGRPKDRLVGQAPAVRMCAFGRARDHFVAALFFQRRHSAQTPTAGQPACVRVQQARLAVARWRGAHHTQDACTARMPCGALGAATCRSRRRQGCLPCHGDTVRYSRTEKTGARRKLRPQKSARAALVPRRSARALCGYRARRAEAERESALRIPRCSVSARRSRAPKSQPRRPASRVLLQPVLRPARPRIIAPVPSHPLHGRATTAPAGRRPRRRRGGGYREGPASRGEG